MLKLTTLEIGKTQCLHTNKFNKYSKWFEPRSISLKLIGQFSRDVIGCKTRVKFVNSNWSVIGHPSIVSQIKLFCSVYC